MTAMLTHEPEPPDATVGPAVGQLVRIGECPPDWPNLEGMTGKVTDIQHGQIQIQLRAWPVRMWLPVEMVEIA